MKWTKEPPTEPGWYWIRDMYGVSVIFIDIIDGGIWIYDKINDDYFPIPRDAEWAGPIPEPEDKR